MRIYLVFLPIFTRCHTRIFSEQPAEIQRIVITDSGCYFSYIFITVFKVSLCSSDSQRNDVLHRRYLHNIFKAVHEPIHTHQVLTCILFNGNRLTIVFIKIMYGSFDIVYGVVFCLLTFFYISVYSKENVVHKQFIEGVRTGKSTQLMNITGGYNYHTVRAEKEDVLDRIEEVLSEKGILLLKFN